MLFLTEKDIKMEPFTKTKSLVSLILLVLLLPYVVSSSQENVEENDNQMLDIRHQSISRKLSLQIVVHGFLLWSSMGFLIPVGILIIRLSNREESGRRLRIMFFIHSTTQVLSVILVTAGAVMSMKNFGNTFNNIHQRVGLTLYGLVWLQAVSGFLRPPRGSKRRSAWFFVHWVLGTGVSILGIINVYTGLEAYQKKTSKSMKLWIIFYTAQISCMAFFYLFQDKWEYIQKQGLIMGNEPPTTIQPTDDDHNILQKQNNNACCLKP